MYDTIWPCPNEFLIVELTFIVMVIIHFYKSKSFSNFCVIGFYQESNIHLISVKVHK